MAGGELAKGDSPARESWTSIDHALACSMGEPVLRAITTRSPRKDRRGYAGDGERAPALGLGYEAPSRLSEFARHLIPIESYYVKVMKWIMSLTQ